MAIEVAAHQRALLARLGTELSDVPAARLAAAAEQLAEDFGQVTATAVEAVREPLHMRRRLDQLVEGNRRYGQPFGLVIFDVSGPATKEGIDAETALTIVGAALRESIRLIDEAFRLEQQAICVLAPNLRTVEGMQMAERLLSRLDELDRAAGLRVAVTAGVVACPDHGTDPDQLLQKADAAMWRARAVGQPVGVGGLQDS
jgi:diguanylate cyclase (GGDEF)-like protein